MTSYVVVKKEKKNDTKNRKNRKKECDGEETNVYPLPSP
jgi:hypothetical protein